MIQYFYNSTGRIVGFSEYKTECLVNQICEASTYIDLDQKVDYTQYQVDLTTLSLVAITIE